MFFPSIMRWYISKRARGRIVDHDFAESLDTLAAIEARLDAIGHDKNQGTAFRIIGDWLVREEILWNYLQHIFPQTTSGVTILIPGFPIRGATKALYYLIFGTRIRADISASAVFFRSNMRAFYNQQQMTLWVARQQQSPEKLDGAMVARKRFASISGFRQPWILKQDTAAKPPYILEELVCGRRFGQATDWEVLADKVLPSLFRFYDHGSIRHRRATDVYNTDWISSEIAGLISKVKWKKKWVPLPRFLKAAEECLSLRDETIPLCIGHGDLGKSNFVVSVNGNFVLLDWEISRELPIAEELIKLVCQHPHLVHCLELEIRRRTEDPIAMPPRRQFLLATLDIIAGMGNFQAGRPWGTKKIKKWLCLASMLIAGPDW